MSVEHGCFDETADVYLEGCDPQTLRISGNVTKPALQVLSAKDEIITQISFGSTYYGTDCVESVFLYNNGSECVNYVAAVDDEATQQSVAYLKLFCCAASK